ncbi:Acyl-CoA N-acyltransferase [Metarhizium rileyi]|uniref:Acyl-CoA N-acyltransferase n=1 Tax=Metarhizium rileyi (strain RCEF 4871) TaxID=1649241 RepID=A0A162LS57_METRR|nr:Acyl-CoA N-acyltransferase [Metarhizium rileyi RCEF 4871]
MASPSSQAPVIIRPATEYTDWLDEDISFQNYSEELDNLPRKYAPPAGGLLLAVDDPPGDVLECIALPLTLHDDFIHPRQKVHRCCELKRLYVYPKARGRQVARSLSKKPSRQGASFEMRQRDP